MDVYEVFQRRTHDDPLVHAGSIKAQDLEMALTAKAKSAGS